MKANELMIGDLVNIYVFPNESPKEKDLFPAKITTILTPLPNEQGEEHIECIFKSKDGSIGCAARPVNTCLPIPLTPEILEKNGFKPDTVEHAYKYCYIKDNVSIIESYAYTGGRYRGIFSFGETRLRITLRFVHEFQHALRLCKIEHDIKL